MTTKAPVGRSRPDAVPDPATTRLGIGVTAAAALSYLLGPFTGLFVFVVEPEHPFVRFHAAQSMVVFGTVVAVALLAAFFGAMLTTLRLAADGASLAVASDVLTVGWLVLGISTLALWLVLVVGAARGRWVRVPYAWGMAERWARGREVGD